MTPQPPRRSFHGKSRLSSLLFAGVAAALAINVPARAANLITDPGFESAGSGNLYFATSSIDGGSPSSWTVTQGEVYVDALLVGGMPTGDPFVYDGNNSVNLTYFNPFVPNSITQSVATTPGQKYVLTFWADSDTPNTFSVTENSIAVMGAPVSIADNGFPNATNSSFFRQYSGVFTANSATTLLDFTDTANPAFNSGDGDVVIDDVVLVSTPEPQSIVLMLTGAIAFGLAAWVKRLSAAATD